MESGADLISALANLGFSQYESRIYVGLLSNYGQTAYGLSKVTGVPQPKIYEAIRKLEARGAAVMLGESPQRFAATPPDALLSGLALDYTKRVEAAERAAAAAIIATPEVHTWPEVLDSISGRPALLDHVRSLIAQATSKVYISAWGSEFEDLDAEIARAEDRGVEVIAMAFGRTNLTLNQGQVFRHKSTSKAVYPHHQNRHLAVVADGAHSLWALAVGGVDWTGLASSDQRLVGLIRSFIRHDIYVQKIYSELGPEMESIFGAGLEFLTDVSNNKVLGVPEQRLSSPGIENTKREVG